MKTGRLRERLHSIIKSLQQEDIGVYATSGAFYMFLSLVPLLSLMLSLVPYTPVTEQQVMDVLLDYAPEPFQRLVYTVVSDVYAGSLAVLSVSLITELWSAGRFLSSLMRGIGEIYDGCRYNSFFKRRLAGALYTLALILFILLNMILLLFGERLMLVVQSRVPALEGVWGVLMKGRSIIFLAALTLVNGLLFRYVPHKKLRFCRQLPGAVLSAAVWMGFSRLFSLAAERFALFRLYGSLAIIVLSLLWMYYSLYILFLGAWINQNFVEQ